MTKSVQPARSEARGVVVSQSVADSILSPAGVKTREWGPHFWKTLFFVALNYPVSPGTDKCDTVVRRQYYNFYQSLQWTLPCGWCLESYRRFWKEDDLSNSLDDRVSLLRWVYNLKDKVNKKLMFQERQELAAVRRKIMLQVQAKKITSRQAELKIKQAAARICVTQKSPTFKHVLETYAEARA